MNNWIGKIHIGDSLEVLKHMPDEFVHCVITSPPYWGLRDYGIEGQLGLEKTPEEYVAKMVEVFREVKRVLRKDGTCWLNLGDSYAGGNISGKRSEKSFANNSPASWGKRNPTNLGESLINTVVSGMKPKDLMGIPWRVAFALQADGWWLRSDIVEEVELYCPCGCGHVMEERIWRYSQDRDIIWSKPNPMPESVTDRPTKAHEYIFLLSKSPKYYFDQDAVREDGPTYTRKASGYSSDEYLSAHTGGKQGAFASREVTTNGRNIRTVWNIATQPYKEAHFATFPEEIPERCIKAGTSEKGCCPKCGSPWVRVVETSYVRALGGTTGK